MPSLVDDIAVVSEMAARELERAFLWLALAGLAAVAALAAARLLAWAARRYVDGLRRAGRIGGTALVAATCWAVVHGGIGFKVIASRTLYLFRITRSWRSKFIHYLYIILDFCKIYTIIV